MTKRTKTSDFIRHGERGVSVSVLCVCVCFSRWIRSDITVKHLQYDDERWSLNALLDPDF